jgi:hypothetical protein
MEKESPTILGKEGILREIDGESLRFPDPKGGGV